MSVSKHHVEELLVLSVAHSEHSVTEVVREYLSVCGTDGFETNCTVSFGFLGGHNSRTHRTDRQYVSLIERERDM